VRWQTARGYLKSGYLNSLQYKALLAEIVAAMQANSGDDSADPRPRHAPIMVTAPVASSAGHDGRDVSRQVIENMSSKLQVRELIGAPSPVGFSPSWRRKLDPPANSPHAKPEPA
jgi:hypothetical protein